MPQLDFSMWMTNISLCWMMFSLLFFTMNKMLKPNKLTGHSTPNYPKSNFKKWTWSK